MAQDAVTLGIDPAAGHPERTLALAYAPAAKRPALLALFALDATLGRLARGTRDPIVAQMRLTWWHEAVMRLDDAPPPAQPVLQALSASVLPAGVAGRDLAGLVDGWEALLEDGDTVERHARERGARLFAVAARVLGAEGAGVAPAGEGWAAADLAMTTPDAVIAGEARAFAARRLALASRRHWSRRGRTLGALALVARLDLAGSPPGSPRRVGRLLLYRLTGR